MLKQTHERQWDPRQLIKLVVYSLLLVNFGLYLAEDLAISAHTLRNGGSLLDYTAAFAVSLDVLAWLTLLLLFELETYLLSDASQTRGRVLVMHLARGVCYLFLAHSLYAYGTAGMDLTGLQPLPGTDSLCQLLGRDLSFGSNLTYTELDAANCGALSGDSRFYLIENGTVVTDTRGLRIERELVWLDLAEAIGWLVILLCIEIVVRLQDRGVTRGPAIRTVKGVKFALYLFMWGAAAYWVMRGHYMYAWDEALWILGFFAIEMNLSDWKSEIRAGEQHS